MFPSKFTIHPTIMYNLHTSCTIMIYNAAGSIQGGECDCDYSSGGCKVSKPAPQGKACKCSYKGFWTCGGSVTTCIEPSFPKCKNPDQSAEACLLGAGDCGGYDGCDCYYARDNNCYNSDQPPKNTVCSCKHSRLVRTCYSDLVLNRG